MKWFVKVFIQYADFGGRARRKEYWMFQLFWLLFLIATIIIPVLFDIFGGDVHQMTFIPMAFLAVTIIPSLAVTVRRLHDIGRSGWWVLFAMIIPFLGIVIFIFTLCDSQATANKWGVNPKLYPNWR